jgi:hypothetical protein
LAYNIDLNSITFVSIDVDGIDLEIFKNLGFAPPVILMEGGFNFSPFLLKSIPLDIAANNMQQPISYIYQVAIELNYTPVCFYQDIYLVRSDLATNFNNKNVENIFVDAWYFMPIDMRNYLIDMRAKSTVIKKIEREYFGCFQKNPLNYLD